MLCGKIVSAIGNHRSFELSRILRYNLLSHSNKNNSAHATFRPPLNIPIIAYHSIVGV